METVNHFLKKMPVLVTFLFLVTCIDQQSASDDKEIVTHRVDCNLYDSGTLCVDEKDNIFTNFSEIPDTTNVLILRNDYPNEFHVPLLKNLMNVNELELIEERLGSIMFSLQNMQNLHSLIISIDWFLKNDLSNITLRLPKLKNLVFTSYSPMDLPFDFYCSFPRLEKLIIRGPIRSNILHLPCGENSSCCSHLQWIEIESDGYLFTGPLVAIDAFRNLANLEVLLISPISIINSSNLSVTNFPKSIDFQLIITYSHIHFLIQLRSLTRLWVVESSDRVSESLDFEFFNLPQLATLVLRRCRIENISSTSFKNCSNLTLLDLSSNKISSLTNTDESGNVRNIFTTDGLPRLEYLSLAFNEIQHLDYSMIPETVKVFDVSDNPLSSFSGNETSCRNHTLKQLHANCAFLMDIEHICFPPTLEVISLKQSNIRGLSMEPFSSLNNLKELLLDGNNLLKLDQSALSSNYRSRMSVNIILESKCSPCNRFHKPIRDFSLVLNLNHQSVHMCQYMRTCGDASTDDETTVILSCNSLMWKAFPSTSQDDSNEIYLDENNQTTVDFDLILQRYPDLNVLYLNNSNIHRIEMTDEHRGFVSTSLREIHLQDNLLEFLPKYFFSKLSTFSSLYLQRNSFKQFQILINTKTYLDELHLEYNNISEFEVVKQFNISYRINSVFLQFNEFSKITTSFCDYDISALHLENNKITDFDLDCSPRSRLEKLYLQNNYFTVLNYTIFRNLPNLQELNLEGNRIRKIRRSAFYKLQRLKRVNLGRNKIEEIDVGMFYQVFNLEVLNLGENSLVEIPPLVFQDLNKLQTLHLNRNRITTLALDLFLDKEELKEIHLEENFIESIDLVLFRRLHSLVSLHLNNNNISEINSHPLLHFLSLQELHLNNNQLKVLNGEEFKRMKKLTKLFLHHNEIHQIDKNTFKDLTSLEILTLHENKLKQLEIWNFVLSSNIKNVTIHQNSFLCECKYLKELRSFFSENNFISNRSEIDCLSPESKEYSINQFDEFFDQFCRNNKLIIGLSVSIGLLVLIVSVSVLLYKYRLAIQVMFYSRFKIRFGYDASMDEGKQYDAFVAYSYDDRAFVANELVPRLEDYRLCIHDRDFVVGLFIQENIINAVKHSCCTLMIFSNSFARSQWCKYEFRTAYERTLKDRWRRILVILMEDVNEDDLEDEMLFYLNTTTYLRWGDPLFWEKLYYALPSPTQSNTERNHRLQDISLQQLNR